ncbi:hypothetical protein AAHE18_09G188800 [Arachis hypogaea]
MMFILLHMIVSRFVVLIIHYAVQNSSSIHDDTCLEWGQYFEGIKIGLHNRQSFEAFNIASITTTF